MLFRSVECNLPLLVTLAYNRAQDMTLHGVTLTTVAESASTPNESATP